MALQSSGGISLSDIQTEFGGTNPISMSEYYRGGSFVTDNNTGVPTSGAIDMGDFYGSTNQFSHTITSNQQEIDLSTYLTAQGWDGTAPVVVTIDTGVYIWSDDNTVGGLTIPSSMNGLVTITNNGYIIGRGGDGGGQNGSATDGGPALVNNATGVTLTNASGAFIAGGGGGGGGGGSPVAGGGGGAGGGTGGNGLYGTTQLGGSGGAVGQVGQNSQGAGKDSSAATGGGAGGGGGAATTWFDGGSGGGAGGGRILGTGATGGSGGVASSGGGNQNGGAGGANGNASVNAAAGEGGGGWGAAGYGGGAGGAAISGTAIATYTNNGTVYGTVA